MLESPTVHRIAAGDLVPIDEVCKLCMRFKVSDAKAHALRFLIARLSAELHPYDNGKGRDRVQWSVVSDLGRASHSLSADDDEGMGFMYAAHGAMMRHYGIKGDVLNNAWGQIGYWLP